MRKLKVLSLLALLIAMGAGVAGAVDRAFKIPKSIENVMDPGARSAGVDTAYLITSTTPALVTDADGSTIGSGFIHWIVMPSTGTSGVANSVYAEFRDTATANSSSTKLLPKIPVNAQGTTTGSVSSPIIRFEPPVPFYNGLSVNIIPGGAAPSLGAEWAVGVRHRKK